MRLFQNSALYPAYLPRLRRLTQDVTTFTGQRDCFLADRFGAPHFLHPVLQGAPEAFFANGDEERSQRAWAREQGMPGKPMLQTILLAQIEAHRTEIFYNMDPMRYDSSFIRQLPGCVRRSIAWRAAPSPGADFVAYDAIVSNFPAILTSYAKIGARTAPFFPAHDPVLDEYAANDDRPTDILFVGGYSRHHRQRARLLEAVTELSSRHVVALHLDRSRLTRLADTPLGRFGPLASHRRPDGIRAAARGPLFGRDLYAALSQSKIILNGAIDMAGVERGNMRCFEAMGARAALVSDEGIYPSGMEPGRTLVTYRTPSEAVATLGTLLMDKARREEIAADGNEMLRRRYSKAAQWAAFQAIAA